MLGLNYFFKKEFFSFYPLGLKLLEFGICSLALLKGLLAKLFPFYGTYK